MKTINKSIHDKIIKILLVFGLIFTSFFSLSTTSEAQVNPDKTNGAQAATLDWIRNTALEIVSFYMARSWNSNFPNQGPSWRSTEVRDTDGQHRIDRRQRLIRWDRRPPNEILRDGFVPQVTSACPLLEETDLYLYARNNVKSFFVSTTKTQYKKKKKYVWTPRSSARGIIYQYEIYAPGGVDVNESLGEQSPWPGQCEVAFPGGIRPEFIRSVREMRDNRLVRIWRNPNFSDPGELPEIASRASTEQLIWYDNHPNGGNKDLNKSVSDPDSEMQGANGDVLKDTLEYESHYQTIPDGEYRIGSRLNPNVVVDLSNGRGSPIHAWNYLGLNNQKWHFEYKSEKRAYRIYVPDDYTQSLTWVPNTIRVIADTFRNEDRQLWRIEIATDGFYTIRNLANPKMVLDLTKGLTSNGTPIIVFEEKADPRDRVNQEWVIQPINYQIIPDGEYRIGSHLDPNVVVDLFNGRQSPIQAWNYIGLNNQKWYFEYLSSKRAYGIYVVSDFYQSLTWVSPSTMVIADTFRNEDRQLWRIEISTDGFYTIRNLANPKMVLDLSRGSTSNGTPIIVFEEKENPNDKANQEWVIRPINYQTIPDGEYRIGSRLNPNVVVDLPHGRQSLIHAWNYLGLNNQKWHFEYQSEKRAYLIYVLDDYTQSLTWVSLSTMVIADTFKNEDRQLWRIEISTDGFYTIRNLANPRMVLDLTKGSTSNGTPIHLWHEEKNPKDKANQEWNVSRVDKPIINDGEYKISTKINYKKVIDHDESSNKPRIINNMNFSSSYWILKYDFRKKAYKIYTKNYLNLGMYYQKPNGEVKIDNIDGPDLNDLRSYWMIDYNREAGGYEIRSLYNPTQVLNLFDSSATPGGPIMTASITNRKEQLWNFMHSEKS